ncbi:hypothetical protein [Rhizomicrobium electricum]|uniref:hypothetical protein n=1 Tax=Rhizomicrobium electricum TaxID=480070 RepID=UPI001424723F|nr:hypothetical protein [Rhizomicrobium electricum]NIJ50331.1 hypothetical protein [Rhizomicrobium electricum]
MLSRTQLTVLTIFAFSFLAALVPQAAQAGTTTDTRIAGPVAVSVVRGNQTFLLSTQNAPNGKLLFLRNGQPPDMAAELMPARPDRTLLSVHPAADGLYVLARKSARMMLLRIPVQPDGGMDPALPQKIAANCRNCRSFPALRFSQITDIAIPDGTIIAIQADARTPGITIVLERRGAKPEHLRYDPALGQFVGGQSVPLM